MGQRKAVKLVGFTTVGNAKVARHKIEKSILGLLFKASLTAMMNDDEVVRVKGIEWSAAGVN